MEAPGEPLALDRALVLAATVGALAPLMCWLETRCRCESCVQIPLRLLAGEGHAARTIADVLLRLRCKQCGKPPLSVELIEWAGKQEQLPGGRMPWRVSLLSRQ